MLPQPAKDALYDALSRTYRIDVTHPDPGVTRGITITPEVWWANQLDDDADESTTPPYDRLTLNLDPTGVLENPESVTETLGVFPRSDADAAGDAADLVVLKGRRVYDELNVTVTARGSVSITGPNDEAKSFPADVRAHGITRQVVRFLTTEFPSRPLDAFDAEGNPVELGGFGMDFGELFGGGGQLFADELDPPLRVEPITGRGPRNVSEMVDAAGAQYDAGVRVRYWDSWKTYEYSPIEGATTNEFSTG